MREDLPGPKPLSLRHNIAWTFAGNVVYSGCQWGMLVVLAKLGSPEMVGQFALGLAIAAPIMMFANLQLRNVQATDARREYEFGDYLAARLATTAAALLVIAVVACTARLAQATAIVVVGIGVAKAFESISDVTYGLLQQHERMDRIAISKMIKGGLSLAALGITLLLTQNLVWATAALAGAWALQLAVNDFGNAAWIQGSLRAAIRPHWRVGTLARLVWVSFPLGVASGIASLNTNIPRYVVQSCLGERNLGIFAAISYVIVAANTACTAIGLSATPRLARSFVRQRDREFSVLVWKMTALSAVVGLATVCVVVLGGRRLLELLYTPEYAAHYGLFVLVISALAVQLVANSLAFSVRAARYFRLVLVVTVFSGMLLVGASLVLIPRGGLWGAGWALLVAALFELVVYFGITWLLVRKLRRPNLDHTL